MKTTLETEREAVTSPSLVLYSAPILAELSRETDAALRAESEARERREREQRPVRRAAYGFD
jgi:hypothetical protein